MTTTTTRSDEELARLRELAEQGAALGEIDTTTAIRWVAETFGDDFIVASNMQDAVLIDVVSKVTDRFDVLFLETGYHFAETIGVRDAVDLTYPGVRIITAEAEQSVAEQEAEHGKLYQTAPDRCCYLRKVVPLRRTLAGYSAWITGVRRADAPTRANTPIIQFDERNELVKVNPIAAWTDEEFRAYIDEHGVLENPLVAEGYLSIGCAPCTAKVAPGADPRSGRWAGQSKTECGLHG